MRRGREEGERSGGGGGAREDKRALAARVEELEAAVRALTQRVEQAEAMNTRLERTLYEVTRIHLSVAHMQQQQEQQQQGDRSAAATAAVHASVQLPRLTRPTQEPAHAQLLPPLLPPLQPAATAPFSEYVERQLAQHGVGRTLAAGGTPEPLGAGELVPAAQQRLPDSAVRQMKEWLHANMDHPYPTEADKRCLLLPLHPTLSFSSSHFTGRCLFVSLGGTVLVERTGVTMAQLNTWFINARRRLLPKSKARMSVLAAAAGAAPPANSTQGPEHLS